MARSKEELVQKGEMPPDLAVPEGWLPLEIYSDRKEAQEAGLAILAMGHAYWMLPEGDQYILCVETTCFEAARVELDAMRQLRGQGRAGNSVQLHEFTPGWISFGLYVAVLVLAFAFQSQFPLADLGRVDSVAMLQGGELWRAVTALTLHGDIVHLVSNLVAGAGFAFFVARYFGAASGWFLILLSGALGNLLNAWVYYPEPHFSIGASTAVFGALGLITGIGLRVAWTGPQQAWSLPRWLLPAFGGLTLLGMLGVGEGPIDVAAHISGFLCGTLIGFIGAIYQSFFIRMERYRYAVAGMSLSLIGLAWVTAWAA